MKKIKLTHGKVTLVDDEDFEYLNKFRWHAKIFPCGVYAKRIKWSSRKLGKRKGETINMESAIMGKKDGFIIDHKDGNGLNNQKSNLRFCTYKQNSMNKISRKGSSSKYKGVSWYPPTKKWQSSIRINGVKKHLGCFVSEKDAAIEYNNAAKKHQGEFARLNKI